MQENKYDDQTFFEKYSQMARSQKGLAGAGEWHELEKLLPDFQNKRMLDLGCAMVGTVDTPPITVRLAGVCKKAAAWRCVSHRNQEEQHVERDRSLLRKRRSSAAGRDRTRSKV